MIRTILNHKLIFTPTQRRRFEMRFFKQMTFREIARNEDVDYKAVYKSITQVKKKFKKFFSK